MKKIVLHFFTRRGKFTPPYFWVTLFLCLVVAMLIMKLLGAQHISDTLVLGCLGFVAAWLAVYTWYDKNRPKEQVYISGPRGQAIPVAPEGMVVREGQAPPPPVNGGGYV